MNEYPTADLEREVLGQLLIAPELAESSDLLRDTLFSTPDARKAFAGILALWEELRPASIDPGMLAEKTSLGLDFVVGLVSGNYRPLPANFAWRVKTLHRRRVGARILQVSEAEGRGLVKTGEVDLAKLEELGAMFRELKEDAPAGDLMASMISGAALQALDLRVEWTIDSLIPSRSITLLHSKSGLGKTWLCLQAAKAVSEGAPIFNLTTRQRPVFYVDYENPLPLMVERTRRLDVRDVNFWHLSASLKPPKLDGPDWTLYKRLPAGSLVFIDTARACQDGDENSSQDVGLVMGRLKEIREQGSEIVLLHHTGKVDERGYKGSTAWVDLADHVLSLHRVRRGTLEEIDDDGGPDPDALFSLGTGAKTRFAPARLYLRFDPTRDGFTLAEDPDQDSLNSIRERVGEAGQGLSQTDLFEWAKPALDLSKKGKLVFLLQKGERQGLWTSQKNGRTRLYYAS